MAELSPRPGTPRARRIERADLLGVAFVVVMALAYLSPALKDGTTFAPVDLGTGLSSLTTGAVAPSRHCFQAASCNHDNINGDLVTQFLPWATIDWKLVHAGQFPSWDDLEATGLPQFLNFESAPLALPTLVSYLAPLAEAFLVSIALKLLLAGIGTYLLCRVLGARPVAAALGGTTYMLSGAFSGWLGWAVSGPFALAGFIGLGLVWSYRTRHRLAPVLVLAVAVAFAVYGGFPEGYVLLAFGFGTLLVGAGLGALWSGVRVDLSGLRRIAGGLAAGLALSAPLWLPGLGVLRGSIHKGQVQALGVPLHSAALLVTQGYDGLPIAGSTFFGSPDYFETAAYVGVIALALAAYAVVSAWRRVAVIGFSFSALCCALLAYRLGAGGPVQHLVVDLGLGAVVVSRIIVLLDFSLAVLGAIGAEMLLRRLPERAALRVGLACAVLLGLVVVALALGGGHLAPPLAALRRSSLIWPAASVVALVGGLLALLARQRRGALVGEGARRGASLTGLGLLLGESAFLLFAGVGINSYAAQAFPATAATTTLTRLVGSALVGLDGGNTTMLRQWTGTGLYPNINLGYGVDELALHDPTAPTAYFASWPEPVVDRITNGVNLFAPAVTSVALAQRYGAAFVLVATGVRPPSGMSLVARLVGAGLYRVPGAARFVVSASGDRVVSVAHPGDVAYTVSVRAPRPTTLVAHLTDVAGWQARADGQALAIRPIDGVEMAVALPAGTRQVTFVYRLPHEEFALLLAVLGGLGLALYGLDNRRRPWRGRRPRRLRPAPGEPVPLDVRA